MTKSAMIRARVDPGLKEDAESVFAALGLSATQAITLFYLTFRTSRSRYSPPLQMTFVPA